MGENHNVKYDPEVLDFLYSRNEEGLKDAYGDLERTEDPIERSAIELLILAAEKERSFYCN